MTTYESKLRGMFKKGDRVKCVIGPSITSRLDLKEGQVYKVEEVMPGGHMDLIRLVGASHKWWDPRRFALVEDGLERAARKIK